MGAASSCTKLDLVSEDEIQAAIKSISDWEDFQLQSRRASEALRAVRKNSFRKAASELYHKGSIVERLGGVDRVHDVIQAFYRKLFNNTDVRHFFENLSTERMRAKQMKFMRYIVGGPGAYSGNLRCVHRKLISEQGLDLDKFAVMQRLLMEVLTELLVPQDVVDDIRGHLEAAQTAIFTPNANELVTTEEMVAAVEELRHPLVAKIGGAHAVQAVVQSFYRRLFTSEALKYFYAPMSAEQLRNMQFRFMRYLFAGPGSYAQTGGNMRCVHARMVKEDGLDLQKFNMVVQMLVDAMTENDMAKAHMREVLANVAAAKAAIFTPGPDELVSKEELVAEAAGLGGELVGRLGGPEAVYDIISSFYSRLFNDEQLKYFFMLSAERLRTKQFRFMRYLLSGPEGYSALGSAAGGMRCKHLALIRDKGLDTEVFDRVAKKLRGVLADHGVPPDVVADIQHNVDAARSAIFTPGRDELIKQEELVAAAESLDSDLVRRLGGPTRVFHVISCYYSRLFNDDQLKYFFVSLSDQKLRAKQFKFMSYLFGGPAAYGAANPGVGLRCTHARLVKEGGLDLQKFDRAAAMLLQVLLDEETPEDVLIDVAVNVEEARSAIFTPGPDELVGREELVAEAAGLGGELVGRLGGPEAVYDIISSFYSRLFNDEQLKYFFMLSAERLRTKQIKYMRYIIGGPAAYSGDLTCTHARLVSGSPSANSGSGGSNSHLDAVAFNRSVGHLSAALAEFSAPADAASEIMRNIESARQAIIFSAATNMPDIAPGKESAPGDAAGGSTGSAAGSGGGGDGAGGGGGPSLYDRLGGDPGVSRLVDELHVRLQSNPQLGHIYAGADMAEQRRQQLGFLRSALKGLCGRVEDGAGGDGGGGTRPASGGSAPGAGAGVGGSSMSLGIAYAHLARDKGLTAAHFAAIKETWADCLRARGDLNEVVVSQFLSLLGPGRSLLFPPGPASGCPFARSLSVSDETDLDAIMASTTATATAGAGSAGGGSDGAVRPRPPSRRASGIAIIGGGGGGGGSFTGNGGVVGRPSPLSRECSGSVRASGAAAAAVAAAASCPVTTAAGAVSTAASSIGAPAAADGADVSAFSRTGSLTTSSPAGTAPVRSRTGSVTARSVIPSGAIDPGAAVAGATRSKPGTPAAAAPLPRSGSHCITPSPPTIPAATAPFSKAGSYTGGGSSAAAAAATGLNAGSFSALGTNGRANITTAMPSPPVSRTGSFTGGAAAAAGGPISRIGSFSATTAGQPPAGGFTVPIAVSRIASRLEGSSAVAAAAAAGTAGGKVPSGAGSFLDSGHRSGYLADEDEAMLDTVLHEVHQKAAVRPAAVGA